MSEGPLLDVLNGRKPRRRPVWFMRQAGRYLPEYREVRATAGSFLDLCYNPKLAAEVTLQPLKRFDLDAAILFADILVVPHAMGLGLRFAEGEGPILETVRGAADLARLQRIGHAKQVSAVCETVTKVRSGLSNGVGLIGFCGGPWTVASYIVEGGSSDRNLARLAAYNGEGWFSELIDRLVEESVVYLDIQIKAGAQAVQIFDSWAGELAGVAREKFVFVPLARVTQEIRRRHPTVPVIVFARGVGSDHRVVAERSGANAVGVETEASLKSVCDMLPGSVAVQGNLDPVALLASDGGLAREVDAVVSAVDMRRHIFNLGHGIRQETDLRKLAFVVDRVRAYDENSANG
jgi:uroporphyrinogen decarboxylase